MSDVQPCAGAGSACMAAGFDSGTASLLDARCGDLAASWAAHGERVTSVAAEGYSLVTGSQVRSSFAAAATTLYDDSHVQCAVIMAAHTVLLHPSFCHQDGFLLVRHESCSGRRTQRHMCRTAHSSCGTCGG